MSGAADQPLEQFNKLLADIEALARSLAHTAERAAEDGRGEAIDRLQGVLSAAQARLQDAEQALRRNVAQGARIADSYVHENTWLSIAAAAAVAFLLGALTVRRERVRPAGKERPIDPGHGA